MERLPGTLLAAGRKTRREVQEGEGDLNFYPVTMRRGEREEWLEQKGEASTWEGKSPRSSLVYQPKTLIDLLIHRGEAVTSRTLGDGFAFCKNYLLGSCWCLLVLSSAFPVCIFVASGFPVELKRIKLDILRFTLKGNTGNFRMACHDRYWHAFNAESLLCALVHRVLLASLLHGKLSFCPTYPWKPWPPYHDPVALLWAGSAGWAAFNPLSPCCSLRVSGSSSGSCVLGCVCEFGL